MKRERRKLRILEVLMLLMGLQIPVIAQVLDVTLEDRLQESSVVIEGEVLNNASFWDATHELIYTAHRVRIYQVIKGNTLTNYQEIELITLGGTVYPNKLEVTPSVQLKPGDIGMFFIEASGVELDRNMEPGLKKYSGIFSSLSFIRYNLKENTAVDAFHRYGDLDYQFYPRITRMGMKFSKHWLQQKRKTVRLEERGILAVNITSFSPDTSTAGTQSVLTINGTGFGATRGTGKVEFSNADNGGASINVLPLANEYVSWSDTQIEVEIPNGAGTGKFRVTNDAGDTQESSSSLVIRYNISNVNYNNTHYRTNLVDADNSGGILFHFATSFNNNVNAKNAFIRALDTWRCSGGTQVYFDDGASTGNNTTARDGENVIRWAALGGSTLGQSFSYWTGCNGGTNWYLDETDIRFDDGTNWNFSAGSGTTGATEIDFESVALHELGHSHQLGHVINSNEVMHYSISAGQEKRTLSNNDLDAGNDVLNWSSAVCGKSAMQAYVCQAMAFEEVALFVEKKGNFAKLFWSSILSKELQSYSVERSMDRTTFQEIASLDPMHFKAGGYYTFVDMRAPEKCWYRVRANYEEGMPAYSNIVLFTGARKSGWGVYPNPFVSRMILHGEMNRARTIVLYDASGREMQSNILSDVDLEKNHTLLSFSSLPKGLYLLVVQDEFGEMLYEDWVIKK